MAETIVVALLLFGVTLMVVGLILDLAIEEDDAPLAP